MIQDYELSENITEWINSNYTESHESIGNDINKNETNIDNEKKKKVEDEVLEEFLQVDTDFKHDLPSDNGFDLQSASGK